MALTKVNLDLVRCDGFWQPDAPGDSIQGIVISANLQDDSKSKGKRRLYVIALTQDAPKKVFLEKNEVQLKKGQTVGINSAFKIDLGFKKLGGARKVCGHEIRITFKGKDALDSGNDLKQYDFEHDPNPTKDKEMLAKIAMPEEGWDRAAGGGDGDDKVPFDVPAN